MSKKIKMTVGMLLASIMVFGLAQGAVVIGDFDTTYTQDFSSLPSTGTTLTWANNSTIDGWYREYWGSTVRDASVQGGVVSEDGFLNVGQDGSTDRALVMRRAYTLDGAFGMVLQNDAGAAATGFELGYTGEQWRRNGTEATSLYFEYAVVSSHDAGTFDILDDYTWTRVSALEFVSPNIVGGNTGLDGNDAGNREVISPVTVNASIADGEYLAIRWYQDRTNTAGDSTDARHALGVNDMSVAMIPEPATLGLVAFPALVIFFIRRLRM
jgi:hypothetical protein